MTTVTHTAETYTSLESVPRRLPQWERIQALLLNVKTEINQSIREYPLPITACDDQFNYLLEKRSAITLELGRFKRYYAEALEGKAGQKGLDEFIASSRFIERSLLSSS